MEGVVPKKVEESECLNDDPNEGTFEHNDNNDAANEANGASQLVLSRKKIECLLWAYDECDAG
jgi:hypothetical protein